RSGFDPDLVRSISRLPHVAQVRSYAGPNGAVMAPDGSIAVNITGLPGSVDGEFFDQDRVTIVEGRMANPSRAGEVVMDAKNTPASVHVGMVLPLGFFTNAQEQRPDFGRGRIDPHVRIDVKVVGKAVFSKEVVQDDVDTGLNGGLLFTPALTRRLTSCCVFFGQS